jgi:hypothetical protein
LDESTQIPALRWAFEESHFVLRFHGHVEMIQEGIGALELSSAARNCEVLEDRDRPEGRTKLLLARPAGSDPIHVVVNVKRFEADQEDPLDVVTVYRPELPWWIDERTRGSRA